MNVEIDFNIFEKINYKEAHFTNSQEQATFPASQTLDHPTEKDKNNPMDLLNIK